MGPDYEPPAWPGLDDATWRDATQAATSDDATAPPDAWWSVFDDPELTRLVEQAARGNRTLGAARERVVEALARRGVSDAERLPQLDARGTYTRFDSGDEALVFQGPPAGKSAEVFAVSALAGWELDLWGRVGRLVEAADADVEARREDLRAAAVSLAAEVALAYVDVRVLDDRLAVLARNVALQEQSLGLARTRVDAGARPRLDVVQAERLVQQTRARRPALERARGVAENRLALLLGELPADGLPAPGATPALPPLPALGIPADLVTRRPDVRAAERAYAAAVARIGAAEAEHYPRLGLSGTFTLQAMDANDLPDRDVAITSWGPSLSVPLFDGGRIASTVEARRAQAEQARLALEQALLAAAGEVENAVSGVVHSRRRADDLDAAADAARQAVDLSTQLYDAGLRSLLDVVDAQRSLVAVEDDALVARQDALAQMIQLYRALGGGWTALDLDHGTTPGPFAQHATATQETSP
ncbi:MAG: TolC family protein [Planctomycetes bacterium]|nr:TolC family protein [Planctomycetota bacterium]